MPTYFLFIRNSTKVGNHLTSKRGPPCSSLSSTKPLTHGINVFDLVSQLKADTFERTFWYSYYKYT